MRCVWCGHKASIKDYLLYPGKGAVPDTQDNLVDCCLACRTMREGRSVASWISDCWESGRQVNPQEIYLKVRELDRTDPTERTGKELHQLRRSLDLHYKTPIKRRVALGEMFQRLGNQCIWCGRMLSAKHADSSYEHLIPKSRGGSDHKDNLLPACMHCNGRRSNLSPAEWIEQIAAEGYQPRIDLAWQSLVLITGPGHGVRMQRRAVEYLDELEAVIGKLEDQPYLPASLSRPPLAKPRRYKTSYRRGRRRRRGGNQSK